MHGAIQNQPTLSNRFGHFTALLSIADGSVEFNSFLIFSMALYRSNSESVYASTAIIDEYSPWARSSTAADERAQRAVSRSQETRRCCIGRGGGKFRNCLCGRRANLSFGFTKQET